MARESNTRLQRQPKAHGNVAGFRIALRSSTSRHSELRWIRPLRTAGLQVDSTRHEQVERHDRVVEWARQAPMTLHYAARSATRSLESIGLVQTTRGSTKYAAPNAAIAPIEPSSVAASLDAASTDRLAEEVIRRVDKRMRIERERRGL
jgi:hypothetical protein